MKVIATGFEGLKIIEPEVHGDQRGYFMESYNKRDMLAAGLNYQFVQDNQSRSKKGVFRGLHFQNVPHAQTKLIRVLAGSILDIVLDLRKDEVTYKQAFILPLTSKENKQLLIPKGFAHGFLVTSEFADVLYKTDDYYFPESEAGINFFDPSLKLASQFEGVDIIMSEKDKNLPSFENALSSF